jgi:hypothetical protein
VFTFATLQPPTTRVPLSLNHIRKSAKAPCRSGKANISIAALTDIVIVGSHVKCNAVAPPMNVQYGFGI